MKSETKDMEASPLKAAAEELAFLRKGFRDTSDNYTARIESQIAQIREMVLAEAKGKKVPTGRMRDARDIVTLIRTLEIKPEKGRRRDLKKVDLLVEDLQRLIENW